MIQVFVTGGTFDKEYNYITGELYFKDTHLSEMFDLGRCTVEIDIKTLMMVDSLEMTEADREIMSHNCRRAATDKILITHGTDGIVETAGFLANANISGKTIVLTGALNPARFQNSDAVFNIGCAIGAVQVLPPGVYIAMSGRVWDPAKVRKNRDANRFEPV